MIRESLDGKLWAQPSHAVVRAEIDRSVCVRVLRLTLQFRFDEIPALIVWVP